MALFLRVYFCFLLKILLAFAFAKNVTEGQRYNGKNMIPYLRRYHPFGMVRVNEIH
mgnify:CR=1 FL=1